MTTFSGINISNALLFDALGKSTLLLVVAFAVALFMRRAPAAHRNLLWRLTFGALAYTTLMSLFLPALHAVGLSAVPAAIPIDALTRQHQATLAMPIQTVPAANPAASRFTFQTLRVNTSEAFPLGLMYAPRVALSSTGSVASIDNDLNVRQERAAWMLGGVWLLGFGVALARFARRGGAARVLEQHGLPLAAPIVQDALARVGQRLDLRSLPALRTQSAASIPFSPLTWGHKQTFVLLPPDAPTWTTDRLEAVLLHELAHIRRGDWRAQRLCELMCAVTWFHPLAWLAARQLRDSAEQACDDIALNHGATPASYARELLAIARTLCAPRSEPAAALPFARVGCLESRLQAVLNERAQRHAPSKQASRRIAVLAGFALLPLALAFPVTTHSLLLTPGAKVTNTSPIIAVGNKATLPDGTIVEMLGVADYPKNAYKHGNLDHAVPPRTWWKPDGTPLARVSQVVPRISGGVKTPLLLRQFAVRTSNLPDRDVSTGQILVADGKHKPLSSNHEMPDAVTRDVSGRFTTLRAVYLGFKPHTELCTLNYGVATGAWTDAAVYDVQTEKTRVLLPGREVTFGGTKNWRPTVQGWEWPMVSTTDDLGSVARRIVGISADGRVIPLILPDYGLENGKTVYITGLAPTRTPTGIREFRLQTRPYQWVEFRDVHLQPNW